MALTALSDKAKNIMLEIMVERFTTLAREKLFLHSICPGDSFEFDTKIIIDEDTIKIIARMDN